MDQRKEKREKQWISRAKNRCQGGQPKEKREKEWIRRGLKQGVGRGVPTSEEKENEWISRGLKQGAGRANLGKKRKRMD